MAVSTSGTLPAWKNATASFTSTKIKVYKTWNSAIGNFAPTINNKKLAPGQIPIFAHRVKMTSAIETKATNTYFIPVLSPAEGGDELKPSLLPKIHERYFFGADIFAFLFAVLVPRAWWIAALFQLGSALAYAYFMTIEYDLGIDLHPAAFFGAAAAIPATIGIALYYRRLTPL